MVSALCKELQLRKTEFNDEVVKTIYFGGGTPSVLEMEEINAIIDTLYQNYAVIDKPEITLEANPDDLTSVTLREVEGNRNPIFESYKKAGINRLSIGIQSFFEEDLKLMNRAHNAMEAEMCLKEASKHFDNISIDLIYGIPDMTKERWKQNIEKALSFDIPHISSYALTVEPKTALASFIDRGIVKPLDDQAAQEHFHILMETLEASGYVHYETSNFCKPGYFSKNNTAYWQGKKYMGIGPSAHSYDGARRGWNINNNPKYLKVIQAGELPMEVETLSVTDRYNEYMMTGLRTIWGVSLSKIESEYGKKYREYAQMQAGKHLHENLLHMDKDTLHVTKKGKFLADGIAADLFMVNLG